MLRELRRALRGWACLGLQLLNTVYPTTATGAQKELQGRMGQKRAGQDAREGGGVGRGQGTAGQVARQVARVYPTIRLTGGAEGAASRRGQGMAGQVARALLRALRAVRAVGTVQLNTVYPSMRPTEGAAEAVGPEGAESGRRGCAYLSAGVEGGGGCGGCEGWTCLGTTAFFR